MTVDIETSHAVESAALARLWGYLRRAGTLDSETETAVRDAFVQGFKSGCRFGVHMSAQLASPEFRDALAVVADGLRTES